MTSAYILIAAILLLGGIIAALGDRLGSKVGKARLRLFNLRPRETAIVVTVMTGTLIAASTLGILFTMSKSLRQGVFELDDILKKRRLVSAELEKVTREKAKVEDSKRQIEEELVTAKTEQSLVQKRLQKTNLNFQRAKDQLKTVSSQAQRLRSDIQTLLAERQQLLQQKVQLDGQIARLQDQIQNRDAELSKQEKKLSAQDAILKQRTLRLQQLENQRSKLQAEINRRDSQITQLDTAIAAKDKNLAVRESQLKELETQLDFLKREVAVLEQYYQNYQELREKRIALVRGQVLAFGILRILDQKAVLPAIDQLLRQANRNAIKATRPGNGATDERVVRITKAQVEQLTQQIQDGKEYVVRVLSAGNYVQGETDVRVFTDVAPNRQIFKQEETIAAVSLDGLPMTEADIQNRLDLLLAAAQFRARGAGILGDIQVEDGRIKTILDFIDELSKSENSFDEIKAIASETTSTVGPLKLRLIAIKNGEILFSTRISS
jgi:uncharacterized protein (DUF3084 family)